MVRGCNFISSTYTGPTASMADILVRWPLVSPVLTEIKIRGHTKPNSVRLVKVDTNITTLMSETRNCKKREREKNLKKEKEENIGISPSIA